MIKSIRIKNILSLIAIMIILSSVTVLAYTKRVVELDWNQEVVTMNQDIKISVDEKNIELEYPVIIFKGRSFVPVRVLSDGLGAKVDWDGEKQQISLKSNK